MQIVVEVVLLENFLINLLVTKTVELFLHVKARFAWLFCMMLSAVTLAIPALELSKIGNFLLVFGCNLVFVALSFAISGRWREKFKKFVQVFCVFYLSSFLYGGACYFATSLIGQNALLVVLIVVCLVFVMVKCVAKVAKHKQKIENFCYDVKISLGKNEVKTRGFLDSGNVLFDPLTGKDVVLINLKTFEKLCDGVKFEDVLTRSEKLKGLQLSHFVSVQSLGRSDKILVFQADKIQIGKTLAQKPILGLSFRDFHALGSDVILNTEIMQT